MADPATKDLVLTVACASRRGIVAAVEAGSLPVSRLDEAATRVTTLRLGLAAQGRGMVLCGDCTPAG